MRVEPVSNVEPFIKRLKDDQRLSLGAMTEKRYYEQQTSSAAPIQFLGIFIAIVMAVGSSFAAMNTMYAAVARRSREIGTLRVLGFLEVQRAVEFLPRELGAGLNRRRAGLPAGAAAEWLHHRHRQPHHVL